MSGPETGSPPSGPKVLAAYDRTVDVLANAFGRAYGRLTAARLSGDRVAEADAAGSLVDLRTAAHIRAGASPDELDRNGWPARVQLTDHTRSTAMRGNPHPTPTGDSNPDVPRGGR